ALILNPIGVIIMAIAAAAYLIYQYWEPISAFFRDLWAKVTGIFSDALDWISGAFDKLASIDWSWWFGLDALSAAWSWVKGFLGRGLATLWDALTSIDWSWWLGLDALASAWSA